MSAVDEIAIKLGIQTGDLKAALSDANASIKQFGTEGAHHADGLTAAVHETHSAFRTLHQFLLAGGLVEAIKGFYETAIKYADKHAESTDNQIQATRRFKEYLEDTTGSIGYLASKTLGFFTEAGEGWGYFIARLAHGAEQADKAIEINTAAAENLKNIAEKHKEALKEIEFLEKSNAELEEKRAATEFAALDHATQRVQLAAAIKDEIAHAATLEENSVEFQKTKNIVLQQQDMLVKLIGEDDHAAAVKQKKDDEEKEANWQDYLEAKEEGDRHSRERAEDAADAEKKAQADKLAAMYKALELEDAAVKKVNDEADAIARAAIEWGNFSAKFNSVGGSVQTLSQVQLDALVVKLQAQQSVQQQAHNGDLNAAYDPLLQETNLMLANAQKEQQLRRDFQQTIAGFGSTYAETHFDAQTFDRLSQLFNPDQAKASAQDLSLIAGTLKTLFPTAAQPTR